MPQSQIETLLAARAAGLGAEIRWSAQVTGIEQDAGEVRVTLADGGVERAAYLAGCDGIRSFTRQAAGLPFPGAPNPGSVLLADLFLDGLPMTDAYGDLSDRGMLLVFPFRDGSCRVVLYDYARADVPVAEPVTLDEVRGQPGPDHRPGPRAPRHRLVRAVPQREPPGPGVPERADLPGRGRRAHALARGRAGHEHRPPGRGQPGLETGCGRRGLGAGLAARQLPRGASSGRAPPSWPWRGGSSG